MAEQCRLMIILGHNIAERRHTLGMTQKFLAIQLGISQEALGKIEKGKMAPKLSRLEDIARELRCSVPYLMTDFSDKDNVGLDALLSLKEAFMTQPPQLRQAVINLLHALNAD